MVRPDSLKSGQQTWSGFQATTVPTTQFAGRLRWFIHNWRALTGDPWILETVQGYTLPFIDTPFQDGMPVNRFSSCEREVISREVQILQQKLAVEPVNNGDKGFFSTLLTIPKRQEKGGR